MQETFNLTKNLSKVRRNGKLATHSNWSVFGPVLLVGLGLGLRLFLLDAKSLRLDESYNYGTATGVSSWDLLTGRVYRSGHPPFFYLAWHQWIKYLGNAEFVLRLPMALAGTLQIPAIYLAGCKLFNSQVGLLAALGVTISPFLVSYSQEAGVYSFFATAAACMLGLFWQALISPKLTHWLLFSIAALITLYIHLFTLFLFVVEPLIILPLLLQPNLYPQEQTSKLNPKQSLVRGWLLSMCIRGLALLLVMPTLTNAAHQPAANPLPFVGLPQIFYRLLKTYTYRLPVLIDNHTLPELLPSLIALLLLIVGASPALHFGRNWFAAKSSPLISPVGSNAGLATYALVGWLTIPPLLVFGLSFIVHAFNEPYLICGTNFFWLLLANGLVLVGQKMGKVGPLVALTCGLALVVAAIWWLGYVYFDPRLDREPWREAGVFLADEATPGDVLVLEPDYDFKVVSYYYLGYLPLPTFLMGTPYSQAKAQELLAQVLHDRPPHIWLIFRHDDLDIVANGFLRQQLDQTTSQTKSWQQNLLEIREYSPK